MNDANELLLIAETYADREEVLNEHCPNKHKKPAKSDRAESSKKKDKKRKTDNMVVATE